MERFFSLRKKLESIWNVFSIVNKSYAEVTNQQQRFNFRMKAKLVMEQIQNQYKLTKPISSSSSQLKMDNPIDKYREVLDKIEDESSREKVKKELERFEQMDKHSGEYHKIQQYLDDVISVPWKKYAIPVYDRAFTQKVLEEEVYGLPKVKERILEMISVNKIKKAEERGKGFVILL